MAGSQSLKSYAAGFFQLTLDGSKTTAYLRSVEGGWPKHADITERYGSYNIPIKHAAVHEIDPVSFDFGLSGANSVLQWIKESWDRRFSRRNGQIDHADFNGNVTYEHEFTSALITETTFPALDGKSKEAGYLKVKFQPEQVKHHSAGGNSKLDPKLGTHQKLWTCSAFRLTLDGIDEMAHVNKIESFTIKQGVTKMQTGKSRTGELLPTKIEFPNLKAQMSLKFAEPILEWHRQYVQAGLKDPDAQKTGALEFLAPDRNTVLFRIDLHGVGLISASISKSHARSEEIKRLEFELSVEEMKIDGTFIGFDS